MKILFLNQFFRPDTAATGQLLGDIADHLSSAGEEVTIICGSASYGSVGDRHDDLGNVEVIRLQNARFSRKVAGRMGSYLSFLGGALLRSLKMPAPDVVVTLTTPPLVSLVGLLIQKIRGARHVIWEMDVYPDVAVDLGVFKKGGLAARFFGWLADLPRHRADRIIVLGECMRTRLLSHGIPSSKIFIAENWAGGDEGSLSKSFPLMPEQKPLSILYSGNFGLAHDVETVSQALLKLDNNVQFVFAGGGSRHSWLRDFCHTHELTNADFLSYCERGELNARLASGHIGLVTQKKECLGSAVPSKTYGIMAAGRPLLFIGPKNSTPGLIIERYNCGWQVDCGDVETLVSLLGHLSDHPEAVIQAGMRAHRAYLDNYARFSGVARIAAIIDLSCDAKATLVEQPAVDYTFSR